MRRAGVLVAVFAALLTGCSSGDGDESATKGSATATGPTATGVDGVTPTGPTATGPTADTGGAYSIDVQSGVEAAGAKAAFFTCDGLEGTWRYLFKADFGGGIAIDVDTTVDMEGGDGTMVFGGTFDVAGLGTVQWQDTADLVIGGTAAKPTMKATKVKVQANGALEGIPVDVLKVFPENVPFPIVDGSDRC